MQDCIGCSIDIYATEAYFASNLSSSVCSHVRSLFTSEEQQQQQQQQQQKVALDVRYTSATEAGVVYDVTEPDGQKQNGSAHGLLCNFASFHSCRKGTYASLLAVPFHQSRDGRYRSSSANNTPKDVLAKWMKPSCLIPTFLVGPGSGQEPVRAENSHGTLMGFEPMTLGSAF